MNNANPAPVGNQRPVVPQGYTISAIATGLKIPRQILVLPNGDLLVAEGKGGRAPRLTPKDFIAGYFKSKGTSSVKGGDRLTLLRDAAGDGRYEGRTIFAKDLNAPYAPSRANGHVHVHHQESPVWLAYPDRPPPPT